MVGTEAGGAGEVHGSLFSGARRQAEHPEFSVGRGVGDGGVEDFLQGDEVTAFS